MSVAAIQSPRTISVTATFDYLDKLLYRDQQELKAAEDNLISRLAATLDSFGVIREGRTLDKTRSEVAFDAQCYTMTGEVLLL